MQTYNEQLAGQIEERIRLLKKNLAQVSLFAIKQRAALHQALILQYLSFADQRLCLEFEQTHPTGEMRTDS